MPRDLTLECLGKLIGFDTTSRNSNLELIAWVEDYLRGHGVASRRISDEEGKTNLLATIGPADRPGIVLSGHTDVVPVDGQAWSSDPFAAERRDGRIFGRGSADMKGFLACVLGAVPAMTRAGLQQPLHLAFSYDEEVGCLGVRSLIRDLAAWPQRPLACIVGEPTSMEAVVAHKAKRSLRVTVTGRDGHSSLAPLAVNAVEYAARLIVFIRDIGERLKAEGPHDELFDVSHTTAHTGLIAGGTQLNIVPATCSFEFEFRVLPRSDADALVEEVRAFARDVLLPEMRAVAPESDIAFEYISQFPGLDTDPEAPVVSLIKTLARRNGHGKVAYGTEGGLFSDGGIPTVVCGPGDIAQAHKPDEFIDLEQLDKCETFLARLIASLTERDGNWRVLTRVAA